MFTLATVTLSPIEDDQIRPYTNCPGDTLSYNCSVFQNSEDVYLTWTITLPERTPFTITYNNLSIIDSLDYLDSTDYFSFESIDYMNEENVSMQESVDNFDMSISTILTDYDVGEYIESVVTLTIVNNISLNGANVECSISNMNNDSKSLLLSVNISGIHYYLMTSSTILYSCSMTECGVHRYTTTVY